MSEMSQPESGISQLELEKRALHRVRNAHPDVLYPAPTIGEEARQKTIREIAAMCDSHGIWVEAGEARFYVPVGEFIQHLDGPSVLHIHRILSSLAVCLAGHFGRAKPETIFRFCRDVSTEMFLGLEEKIARVFVNDGGQAADLLPDDGLDRPAGRPCVDGVAVELPKAHRKARAAVQSGDQLVSPVLKRVRHRKPSRSKKRAR